MIGETPQRLRFFPRVGHLAGMTQNHHRPVIHGMMEGGTRQHQPVHQSDSKAHGNRRDQLAQHAAGRGTMYVDLIPRTGVTRWDNVRLALYGKAQMAHKAFIQYGIDHRAVIDAALGQAAYLRPRAESGFIHDAPAIIAVHILRPGAAHVRIAYRIRQS
jgi:hypothetical protein